MMSPFFTNLQLTVLGDFYHEIMGFDFQFQWIAIIIIVGFIQRRADWFLSHALACLKVTSD